MYFLFYGTILLKNAEYSHNGVSFFEKRRLYFIEWNLRKADLRPYHTGRKDIAMQKNKTESRVCSDEQIIELYWDRNERAIEETDRKYKKYLLGVAYNILHDELDCDECLNDTYLGTWNSIPPTRPSVFQIFIFKIMRNTALSRYKKNRASKRIPSELTVSIDELDQYVKYNEFDSPLDEEYHAKRLSRILSDYIRILPDKKRFIFISRYYCSDRIVDIAEMLSVSDRTVFRELTAIKAELKEILAREGY